MVLLLREGWRAARKSTSLGALALRTWETDGTVVTAGWLRWHSSRGFASQKQPEATDSIYISEIGVGSGHTPCLVGLYNHLSKMRETGFFQAIAGKLHDKDGAQGKLRNVELFKSVFKLQDPSEDMIGMSINQARVLIGGGKSDDVIDAVYQKYSAYKKEKEFTLVYGGRLGDLDLECKMANAMQSPMVLVFNAPDMRPSDIIEEVILAMDHVRTHKVKLLGVIVNNFDCTLEVGSVSELRRLFDEHNIPYLGRIPKDAVLNSLRFDEVVQIAKAVPLTDHGVGDINSDTAISRVVVATESVANLLEILRRPEYYDPTDRSAAPLIVTSADRADIFLSLLAAHHSSVGPHVAGVLIGGRNKVSSYVLDIYNSTSDVILPMVHCYRPLLQVLSAIERTPGQIFATSTTKIAQAINLFDANIKTAALDKALKEPPVRSYVPPKVFQHQIYQKCKENIQRIVLPEGEDVRVLSAAAKVAERKLAHVILLGNPDNIKALAERSKIKIDCEGIEIMDPPTSPLYKSYVNELVEARKHKGVTEVIAADQMLHGTMFATMMVRMGDADGMVSGAAHTTADTIRPALQLLQTKDKTLVSSIFFMLLPDRVLVYGDCAVNVDPTAEHLADIARVSADTARAFGLEPRVAMLSYSTLGSGAGPQVEKVEKATQMLREQVPDLDVEGPIQYDAAVDPRVAESKVKKESKVAGRANVLVFPDLNTGNNTYKAVQQSTGGIAMGPVLQGLAKPVNDLSRGCTVDDIINTVCITAVQAISSKEAERQQATGQ